MSKFVDEQSTQSKPTPTWAELVFVYLRLSSFFFLVKCFKLLNHVFLGLIILASVTDRFWFFITSYRKTEGGRV